MKVETYEIVVVGGGMVGATLALMLSQSGFRVLIVDSVPLPRIDNSMPDVRVSAINYASINLLRRLKVWQHIGDRFCVPYRRLEVWDWVSSIVSFDAAAFDLTELGFIVENHRLQSALWTEFTNCDLLNLRCPASIYRMTYQGNSWQLILSDGSVIKSRIVVGADGAKSWVRKQAGIEVSRCQYRQACLVLRIRIKNKQQQDVTWQQFCPNGPKAFLPLYERWALLIWYDTESYICQLEQLTASELVKKVKLTFPARLGPFTLHGVKSFSLVRQHACKYVKPGLALIGDAAHIIHPMAGQGLNLGFRDVQTLSKVLIDARQSCESWDTLAVLQRYQHQRWADNFLMQMGIDMLHKVFSNNLMPIILARNMSLMLVENFTTLKFFILCYALGLKSVRKI